MPKKSKKLVVKDSLWLKKKLNLKTLQRRIAVLIKKDGYSAGQAAAILTEEICGKHDVPPKIVTGAFILFWGIPATD